MCGIAAIFNYATGEPVNRGQMGNMLAHMERRGPDGSGEWYGLHGAIGLGHRRLAIIDVSPAGAQPMLWPERQLAIVFNGEIYNYRELRAALETHGHTFKSFSDTEVLLHLYAEHGGAMLTKLRGMFAFVIWDGQQQGMLLARDSFGIKPLYIADDGKTLRAASQVKALLAGGDIAATPDAAGHVGFFLWGHVPEPHTFHQAIRSLPAGSWLWIGADGKRETRSFSTVTEILARGENHLPADNVRTRFDLPRVLRDSVAHHLIADVPVGVFLSSGLDSTTLAALAAEQGGSLRTVTLGFEEFRGLEDDETPLAELVARRYGAQHETIWVTRQNFQAEVENLFRAMDLPTIDGVNTYFVSLAAKRAGMKVALSGLGGDELFGGYPAFSEVPRMAGWLGFLPPENLLGRGFRAVSSPLLKQFTSPKYAGLLEYGGSYGGAYLLRRGLFMPWELPEFLDADLVRQGWNELHTLCRLEATTAGLRSARAKVSALEMNWYMRNQLLRDADWAGMAHSLEIRVPLVDLALLKAVAPTLAANPPSKREMADASQKKLPPEILNRPKTGFRVPVRDWLMEAKSEVRGQRSEAGGQSHERGLRGWARQVYSQFVRN
jgi:asparagine synthase (glutamine-hydrolysing)